MSQLLLISVLAISALPLGTVFIARKLNRGESDEEIATMREEARLLEEKIVDILSKESGMVSKRQLAATQQRVAEYTAAVDAQRNTRLELEQKLEKAHADVLTRESSHQEMKSEKQDDEVKLQNLLSTYQDISSESVSLERQLADSLKTIDKMSSEIAMTEDQRAVFDSLTVALTNASAQLRDVIVAHQNAFERLEALRSQYTDLEAEYIKLVELQLEA